ncbi:MAG: glycosyltransferase [Euryarchaeota archaeon]|jgi:glycosyltransferase involved in cell wall biosynthesis|nr:glycosyltransferase [Euryarchaeota archaeon]MBT4391629.1 glycosyltransferase [Euryarchaeota archaeon]MBT4802791.1 glycosyltransferase [Euryarchaeota archaeon]MBT5614381.1 glycosyltransferase [Euryarchaeota archaeon]MBT6684289.1 glycosyltransferase [Euryarchaeota archaeon]
MAVSVDVVIPTFRRPAKLAKCLESLSKQTVSPNSIEVIDDSETDYGPGISRNIGWKRGNADAVAFLDDDCIAPENWIETIQEILENPDIGGIEGAMTTQDSLGNTISYNPPNRFKWDRFKTANLIIRREALEIVNGFDERYFLHREDTDLAWKVIDAGYSIVWSSKCIMHHPEPLGSMGIYAPYPRSEQLLYRCNPKKYVESAAGLISFESIRNGSLWQLQRELRIIQTPNDVKKLNRFESWNLWSRAWLVSIFWIIRKNTIGEPKGVSKNLR